MSQKKSGQNKSFLRCLYWAQKKWDEKSSRKKSHDTVSLGALVASMLLIFWELQIVQPKNSPSCHRGINSKAINQSSKRRARPSVTELYSNFAQITRHDPWRKKLQQSFYSTETRTRSRTARFLVRAARDLNKIMTQHYLALVQPGEQAALSHKQLGLWRNSYRKNFELFWWIENYHKNKSCSLYNFPSFTIWLDAVTKINFV